MSLLRASRGLIRTSGIAGSLSCGKRWSSAQQTERWESMQNLLQSSNFKLSEIHALSVQFQRRQLDGNDTLTLEEFKQFLSPLGINSENSDVAHNYFRAFDKDGNGEICFKELVCGLSIGVRGTAEEKARLQFDVFDKDKNGTLDKTEFLDLVQACSEPGTHCGLLEALAHQSFESIDRDKDGSVSFAEFKRAIVGSLSIVSGDRPTDGERDVLELLGTDMTLKAGDKLAHTPQARAIYILEQGHLEATFLGKHILEVHDRDVLPFIGEVSLFSPVRSLYGDVTAKTDCRLKSLQVVDILPLVLHDHPGTCRLMERLGGLMFQRLKHIEDLIQGLLPTASDKEIIALTSYSGDIKKLLSLWALAYHTVGNNGKLEVVPSKRVGTAADLSVAYSPGVAEPCIAIKHDPSMAYDYTSKGHLVGVVSNGTAVLGLGNIGALASKPVMEGKAVLFKQFGGLDAFDIEVAQEDPEKFIDCAVAIAPTFGGMNLEDIKAPECFYIEPEVQRRVDIPIMHDDQHGTAIIAGAGLLNALELVGKNIEDIRVVVSGCGAAGFTCARYFHTLGVRKENIIACDVDGVVHQDRADIKGHPENYLSEIATFSSVRTLAEAIEGADVFAGLSVGGLLKPEMLLSMAKDPLVFAMANPMPEIAYPLAKQTRSDVIMGTGRSDYPNQLNNVSAFPFIFRGAIDVRASEINAEMKMATTKAIAALAKQDHPSSSVMFGRDYIIPKPFDKRLLSAIAPAVARAAIETGVARVDLDVNRYRFQLEQEAFE